MRVVFGVVVAILATGLLAGAGFLALTGNDAEVEAAETIFQGTDVGLPANAELAEWVCPSGSDGRATCGFVSVPADYSTPEDGEVGVFVMWLSTPIENDRPPLVFLGDTLGRGSVDQFVEWREAGRVLDRDIILVDHRGSGLSDPQVSCVDLGKVPWLEIDVSQQGQLNESRELRREAVNRCIERLDTLTDGASFTFDTLVTDLERVRIALDIDQWVIAASADTVPLAVSYEDRNPASVDSLVLLRASEPEQDRFAQRSRFAEEVLAASLGSQAGTLDRAQEQLGSRSVAFTTDVGDGRQLVSISQPAVLPVFAQAIAAEEFRERQDGVTDRLLEGQWRELAISRGADFTTADFPGVALRLAVDCQLPTIGRNDLVFPAEESDAGAVAIDGELSQDTAQNWLSLLDDPTLDSGICPPSDDAREAMMHEPRVPVLILNQAFDVIAPESAANALDSRWATATTVVLESGDVPTMASPCVLDYVESFLSSSPSVSGNCE